MKKLILLLIFSVLFFSFSLQNTPPGLKIGDIAPDFSAKDQNGKFIVLKELTKQGPVVLVFYRGEWCPYCNKQLLELSDSIPFITAKGARVIAISPENLMNVEKTVAKTKATYSIISDEKTKIMTDYKVAFSPDEMTIAKYKNYGIDLAERNGTNGNNLPVPSVYIINTAGKITFRHLDENITRRVSIKEILSHL
jgi:peroxiredoxin